MSESAIANGPKCIIKGCVRRTKNLKKVCTNCLKKKPWAAVEGARPTEKMKQRQS